MNWKLWFEMYGVVLAAVLAMCVVVGFLALRWTSRGLRRDGKKQEQP